MNNSLFYETGCTCLFLFWRLFFVNMCLFHFFADMILPTNQALKATNQWRGLVSFRYRVLFYYSTICFWIGKWGYDMIWPTIKGSRIRFSLVLLFHFSYFLTYLHFWWLEPPFTFSQSNMAMAAMAQLVQWFTHRTWRSWLYSYVTKYEVHAMVKSPPFFPTFWLVKSPIPRIFFSDKAGRCRSPGIFPPCLTGAPGCQHRHAAPQRAAAGAGRAAENGTRVREAGVLQQSGFVSIEQWSRPLLVDEWGLY